MNNQLKIFLMIGIVIISGCITQPAQQQPTQSQVLDKDPITLLPNRIDIYSLTKQEKVIGGVRVALAVREDPVAVREGKGFVIGAIRSTNIEHVKSAFFSQILDEEVFPYCAIYPSVYNCRKTSETPAQVQGLWWYVIIYRCSLRSGYQYSGFDERSLYLYVKDYGDYFFFIASPDRGLVESGLHGLNNNVGFSN